MNISKKLETRWDSTTKMYRVQLNNFEGPIDLLLYFIRRDELDVYDIPISKITKEFVHTIEEWKKMNLHVAGDFIVMASTLMRIKAKYQQPLILGMRTDPYGG